MLLVVPSVYVLRYSSAAGAPATPDLATMAEFRTHIRHIVIVMMENHAFDNYFGVYCPTVGPYCPMAADGIPNGTCVALFPHRSLTPCVVPFNYTTQNLSVNPRMLHDYVSSHAAWANGSMNGFYLAERSGLDPFGHYNGATAPLCWDLAQSYGLGDRFFSATLSYSLPNHWFMIAGSAPPISFDSAVTSPADRTVYLQQANATRSAEDLLSSAGELSWEYYDYALPNWTASSNVSPPFGIRYGNAFNYWNPQAAKYESYGPEFSSHFVPNTAFFSAAANGTLPSVSWVIPYGFQSDHPPDNVTSAESWVASVVDAVETSPDWGSTALYLSWDDYGGGYDHVDPPMLNGTSLSFRVPLIVISPYTPAGLVDHENASIPGLLTLVEQYLGLGCLTAVDCGSIPPLGYFNFSALPREPIIFATDRTLWAYPLHSTGATTSEINAWRPPAEFTSDPAGDGPDVD